MQIIRILKAIERVYAATNYLEEERKDTFLLTMISSKFSCLCLAGREEARGCSTNTSVTD